MSIQQWFPKSMVPRSAASVSSGNLLEMQILGPPSRSSESETLGVGISNLCLPSPQGDFAEHQSLKITAILNKATFMLKNFLPFILGSHLLRMVRRKFFFQECEKQQKNKTKNHLSIFYNIQALLSSRV